MSRREEICVPGDEILRQREFMRLVREQSIGEIKKYNIQTFGCQMNENDSERLAGMLSEMGYVETENRDESDLIIYNTCCVRENAELKVYGHLGSLKKLKEKKPDMIIAVCGCMMQQPEVVEHIKSTYRHVDLIFGTHNLHKFPELVYNVLRGETPVVDVMDSAGFVVEGMPIRRSNGIKAWVTIMYGCNNFCSYCIVPYVRGRERSRSMEVIYDEVLSLAREGYSEITLLGQNVNSYGLDLPDKPSFADLLRKLDGIDGIKRIRFMTSHPKDLSDDLIDAMRDLKSVCPHLHLPLQAGSTKVLREMNRKYTKEQYIELAERIKSRIPGIALTTDIIVGFPGETEEDFLDTLDVVEKVRFDMAYTFLYSKRAGTPAARRTDQVPEETKKQRFDRLIELQNRISREINEALKGTVQEILVEGPSKTNASILSGRTSTNKIVNFRGSDDLTGKYVRVKISDVQTWSLEGVII